MAFLALIALLGACGSKEPAGTTSGGGSGTTVATRTQAVRFSDCMRSHGIGDFPDPDASGQLTIDGIANDSSIDTNSAAFTQALTACKSLEPAGFTGNTRSAQQQAGALQFAQCVRDHGVKDFPDPSPDAPLIDTNRIPSAASSTGMSILNAALQKCRTFAAAAGVTGQR